MNVTILCVGKLKESYWREAVAEYSKRLCRYCSFSVTEVADEKTRDVMSEVEINLVKEKEGEKLLKHISEKDYVVALAIEGKQLDSVAFSQFIEQRQISGDSNLKFVIGGSLGLDDRILRRADYQLSFSKMTFPHQMMRVVLLEQIYRSYRIMKNEPYHK